MIKTLMASFFILLNGSVWAQTTSPCNDAKAVEALASARLKEFFIWGDSSVKKFFIQQATNVMQDQKLNFFYEGHYGAGFGSVDFILPDCRAGTIHLPGGYAIPVKVENE